MKTLNTYQVEQNMLTPTDATSERMRRMEDCLQRLLELEVDDRAIVISLVKEYENEALRTALEKRFGEGGVSIGDFLSILDDDDEQVG
jgi:hypothetical protein